jgi:hypothetical protein
MIQLVIHVAYEDSSGEHPRQSLVTVRLPSREECAGELGPAHPRLEGQAEAVACVNWPVLIDETDMGEELLMIRMGGNGV